MGKIRLKYIGSWIIQGPRAGIKSFFAQEYFKSHITIWLLILSLTTNLINWAILKIWIQPVAFPIILHYNVYFGVDLVGGYRQVYILPLIGFILFLINSSLSIYFYGQKERIASYILLIAVLMIQLSLVVASTSIILINY
ncbi:MAG: hypothetical protein Q8L11_01295 [Candidatus Moranbacteria bacterium]|nr:hypothetical protein [Candidatus Moranbacteria bacterium]